MKTTNLCILCAVLFILPTGCSLCNYSKPPRAGGATYRDSDKEITYTQPEGAKEPSSFEVDLTNGVARATFGTQYDNTATLASFSNFKTYHIAAILLMVGGVAILVTSYVPNRWGIVSILSGAGLGAFAHFVPSNGPLVSVLLISGVVAAVVYLLWNYIPKNRG